FFTEGKGQKYKESVSKEQWEDLTHFEGNANALRILTYPFNGKDPKGFALTYTSLAAIVKYPCAAIDGHVSGAVHRKKYGFFESEKQAFEQIANELGLLKDPTNPLGYLRHPLVYLVEAADDICYNIIDLEDAHHLNILSYQEVEDLLLPLCGSENLRTRLDSLADTGSRVSLLRAKAINTLITGCAKVFVEHQQEFLLGTFGKSLMDSLEPEIVAQMKLISKISIKRIYNAPTVVQIEIAGFRVLNALLEEFIPAYLKTNKTMFDKKLVAMIPAQFYTDQTDTYTKIRAVLDFVSGMTDVYAIDLYRKIKGISIPSLD
ncbi:MAG: dGTP triphosphohydrolase, partial [Sphingobacterium sp.]